MGTLRLLLVVILVLWACGPPERPMAMGVEPMQAPIPVCSPTLVVPPVEWRTGTVGDEARLALLVATDRYLEPSWAISSVSNNLQAMRQALAAACAIPPVGMVELTGSQVHRDAVRAALAGLGRQIKGRSGVLVVYWTGHGFIDARGEAQWFTYYTSELASGGYDNVISRADLASWIIAACGTGITPLIIADVCRPRINAPPPPATLHPLYLWELQATRAGRFSEAPPAGRASPFTRALVDSLTSLAQTGSGGIEELFVETSRRCIEATDGRQEPELIRPAIALPDPRLVRSQRIVVAVEAVDAIGGRLIPGFSLRLDARPAIIPANGSLEVSPGRHLLRLSAPGYCARVEEMEFSAQRSGSTLRLALLPSLVRISGRVEPAGVYGVGLRGLDHDLREGFHRVHTSSDAAGAFTLHLPGVSPGIEVIVTSGARIIGRATVPATLDRYRLVSESGIEGIREGDLGVVRLSAGAVGEDVVAKAAAGLTRFGAIPQPARLGDLQRSVPSELRTAVERNRWEQALRLADVGRWSIAADQLQQIAGQLPDDLRERWMAYLFAEQARSADLAAATAALGLAPPGLARAAVAAVLVSRILDGSPDPAALQQVARLEEQLEPAAQAVSQERRIAKAAALIASTGQQDDPAALLDWLVPCTGPAWAAPAWQAARRQGAATALAALTLQAVERGLAGEDWSLADRAATLAAALPEAASDPGVSSALQRLQQERQPAAVRTAYARAQDAFASGDAGTAYALYLEARQAGANAHYLVLIRQQLDYLRQQLFIRHFNSGLEHELEGRLALAVASYSAARVYDPGVRADVERLRTQAGTAADLHAALATYDRQFQDADVHQRMAQAAFDAALAEGSTAALRAVILRHPDHQQAAEAERLLVEAERAAATAGRALAEGGRAALEAFVAQYPQQPQVAEARRRLALIPAWASASGRDSAGTWVGFHVHSQLQILRLIPAGGFRMGSENGDGEEKPVHEVIISQAFWLGDSEVTQGLWLAVMGSNPSTYTGDALLPVEQVSWEDCQGFFKRLNGLVPGLQAGFPSEAQWEYACRAGTTGDYAGELDAMAWYDGNSGQQTHPVKSKRANAWGLYDMHGNAWEWCADWNGPYAAGTQRDPGGPATGSFRVRRGGGCLNTAGACLSAYRNGREPVNRRIALGLRLAAPIGP